MTAIEALLLKAAELSSSSMEELSPGLEEIASARAAVAEAMMPFLATASGVSEGVPFRYGFVLPPEPPEIRPDQEEAPKEPARSEVSLGPINVYAITREIQKALENVGHDSTDIRAIYSSYAASPALTMPHVRHEDERRPDLAREQQPLPPLSMPIVRPEAPAKGKEWERRQEQARAAEPAPAGPRGEIARAPAGEWVEQSIRRSNVVMSDLTEVRQNIVNRSITTENISTEAQSISAAVVSGGTVPTLPEKQMQQAEEPARNVFSYLPARPAGQATPARAATPPSQQQKPEEPVPGYAGHVPAPVSPAGNGIQPQAARPVRERAKAAVTPDKTGEEKGEILPQKFVHAPPLRMMPKPASPAEESEYNARRLSEALSMSAESGRPLRPAEGTATKEESAPRASWPVVSAPVTREPRLPETPQPGEPHRPPFHNSPAQARETRPPAPEMPGSPVAQVIRSMGAMGEYVRAASEISRAVSVARTGGISSPGGSAGLSLITAMSGAPAAMPVGEGGRPAEIRHLAGIAAATTTVPAHDAAALSSVSPLAIPGNTGSRVQNGSAVPAARVAVPGLGLVSGIAAAQAGQRSGAAMIRQLIQSAPHVTGSVAPQAPAVYDPAGGLPWSTPVTPSAASGAENIVNITVPGGATPKIAGPGPASKVSNFHNTFNITVNVKSGEERELKDLGKKIGQILSEEIKRYGGI
ncbi:hypothetical protein [Methanocella sp. MCL-LM]|uniref:hypothetical protein n=1 Tax=Methanocella sp. MCL-LM TaxID=3412035 RepID=UPI003C71416D